MKGLGVLGLRVICIYVFIYILISFDNPCMDIQGTSDDEPNRNFS